MSIIVSPTLDTPRLIPCSRCFIVFFRCEQRYASKEQSWYPEMMRYCYPK